jgi:L-alanine-DL-glutamate epimerase-like enolase superfamily enzyme
VRVIPHGHHIHAALHVAASRSPMTCPMVESLVNFMPEKCFFKKNPLHPVNGKIILQDRPGFGIELDDSRIEGRKLMK